MAAICQPLALALAHYHGLFAQGFSGVPTSGERCWLAQVVMGRLLLLDDLQRAGGLAGGDRWYLHNQLTRHLSQSPRTTFFKGFLQPLWHQGLSLPLPERSPALQAAIGAVPYLGGQVFQAHPLEQQYPHLDLPNEPIEQFLGWLAEQPWQRDPSAADSGTAITRHTLAAAYDLLLTGSEGKAGGAGSDTLGAIAPPPLDAYLLKRLSPPGQSPDSLDVVLGSLTDATCRQLVLEILPPLTILDPACGSGRWLLMALARLQTVYEACWAYAQTATDPALQAWVRSLRAAAQPPQWVWTQHILTQNLYGVDESAEAIAVTQLQLWLSQLATATAIAPTIPLADLDFTIVQGNALIGFIRVDAESFDQISPKRSLADDEAVLQGDLLQPLAAASYHDTLAEKKIRVEHYQAQTQALSTEGSLPEYARTEFLRDRLHDVNHTTQQKLDRLLLEMLSRKLGIKVPELQPSGKSRQRLLTPGDISTLRPLHWGFCFNHVFERRGGFDVIMTHRPRGSLRPHSGEFYHHQADLFHQYGIEVAAWRRSRRQILLQFPELLARWNRYAAAIACLKAYVRRSDDYPAWSPATPCPTLPHDSVLAHRCHALTHGESAPPYLHPPRPDPV